MFEPKAETMELHPVPPDMTMNEGCSEFESAESFCECLVRVCVSVGREPEEGEFWFGRCGCVGRSKMDDPGESGAGWRGVSSK